MLFDPIYWVIVGVGMVLSLGAGALVKSAFARSSQVPTTRGLTGAQVAQAILDREGIDDVQVHEHQGFLSDHYNPMTKTLALSPDVYHGQHCAAAGVAAHEVGHAIQHAHGYIPLQLRSLLVPAAQFGSGLGPLMIVVGIILGAAQGAGLGTGVAWLGLALFACATLFSLVTLPVEFDASARAKRLLVEMGLVDQGQQGQAVAKVLTAAGLTYVAAALTAIMQLLYWAVQLGLLGNRDE